MGDAQEKNKKSLGRCRLELWGKSVKGLIERLYIS